MVPKCNVEDKLDSLKNLDKRVDCRVMGHYIQNIKYLK